MHIFNPEIAFLPMLNLLLAGMLLGASYLYTRNLCFPISLHLFWNWIQGPILGYQVSGNNFTTSMLTLRMPRRKRTEWRSLGFEGSLILHSTYDCFYDSDRVVGRKKGSNQSLLYPDHTKLNPFPVIIYIHHSDHDVLMDGYHFRRIGNEPFR